MARAESVGYPWTSGPRAPLGAERLRLGVTLAASFFVSALPVLLPQSSVMPDLPPMA